MRFARYFVLSVALVGLVAVHADAAPIRVSQESAAGAGDFDANILGTVDVFNTALTTAAFYQYGNPFGSSYNGDVNGGPSGADGLTQLFLVQASDGLSLVIVHDDPVDGSGGTANTRFDLVGDTATITVKDDGEPGYVDTGTQFSATHNWIACCTDGYAITSLDGNWTMFGQFTSGPTGITQWQVSNSGGADVALVLQAGRRVRLDLASSVPEPSVYALLGAAFVFCFLLRRR
ncbi:MAG: PEP-CTERM sorting domain-containing protein [Planctomycetota bacterium]|jgi:hypothetical protein